MAGVEEHSEYEGGGVMPNTVFPKGTDALTAGDKLRLQSITGQETDSRAPVDPAFWHGGLRFDPNKVTRVDTEYRRKQQEIARQEKARYKESPY